MKKFHKVITSSLMIAALGFGMVLFGGGDSCQAAGNIHHRGRTKSFFKRAVKPQKATSSIFGCRIVKKIVQPRSK